MLAEHLIQASQKTTHTEIFLGTDLNFSILHTTGSQCLNVQINTAFPIIHKKEFTLKLPFTSFSPEVKQKKRYDLASSSPFKN